MERLNESSIDFFHNEGYLTLENGTSDAELTELKKFCKRLMIDRGITPVGLDDDDNEVPTDRRLCWIRATPEDHSFFEENVSFFQVGKKWASTLLGVDSEDLEFRLRVFYKFPDSDSPVAWHQDEAFYQRFSEEKPEGYRSLNCWIALNEATPENGCLKYIPKSHLKGLRHHELVSSGHHEGLLNGQEPKGDEQDGSTLVAMDVDDTNKIYASLPEGGVSIHHSLMLHGSDKNNSSFPRGAIVIIYQQK